MRHVPLQLLRRFQLALLGLDALVLGLYVYGILSETGEMSHAATGVHSHGTGHTGLTPPTLIAGIALFHVVFTFGVVWWLDKRHTWATHAAGALASGIMIVLLVNSESPIHMMYHVLFIGFMFFVPMVGTLVAGIVLAFAFLLLIISSLSGDHLSVDPMGHVIEMILVSLSSISASGGWFVFNKRYIQHADKKVVENLTQLVKQERSTVSLILESISDGVMIINTQGVVQILNASSARILGWPQDEAQNLQYNTLLELAEEKPAQSSGTTTAQPAPKAPTPIAIAETFKTQKAEQQVSLLKTRDGREIYVDVTASPIIQDQSTPQGPVKKLVGVIAVLRDVDKQKREEAQRSEFISTASHEMRTPVAAIEGYLALAMNDKVSQVDPKARSYLEKAHSSTQHLGKLFQDLLTSAKAEDGRLVSHPVVVEMTDYLQQLTESLKFAAEKKGLLMDFAIGAGAASDAANGKVIAPLYYVYVDPDRLREVITNLFDNAVKYTETGKISLGLTGDKDVVQFYVRDTGPGIPADDLPHLFQKFYRVDNSATRTIGGTGLGLFICRKIVELYHGRIWAESELKKGSTFYINLPRLSASKAAELQASEATQAANAGALSS